VPAKYAVLGNPIAHSLSPRIHSMFAAHQGIEIEYEKLQPPIDKFPAFVAGLHQSEYRGLNVTAPFKLDAYQLADSVSERAWLAKAVNTLIRTDSSWIGDNTDGAGLTGDLRHLLQHSISGARILILGAGGSVQGILPALVNEQAALIHIANRTAAKAMQLANTAVQDSPRTTIQGSGLDAVPDQAFDILINATTSGLSGDVPQLKHLPKVKTCCYDLFYAAEPTAFLRWCKSNYAANKNFVISDGLGMLVRQAAESYQQWHNRDLDDKTINNVLTTLRNTI